MKLTKWSKKLKLIIKSTNVKQLWFFMKFNLPKFMDLNWYIKTY